jgi:hypothetical protein
MLTCNGIGQTAKYLKVALFAVYSYLSGNPLKSTVALGFGIRLRSGLPLLIPVEFRRLIRNGDLKWIRIWVSILNIYRAFNVKTPDPETAYKTIRKPLQLPMPNFEKFTYFARYVFPALVKEQARITGVPYPLYKYTSNLGLIIRSAAANLRGLSLFSIILDAKAWFAAPTNHILDWFKLHKDATAAALMTGISREEHFPRDDDLRSRQKDFTLGFPPFKDAADKQKYLDTIYNPFIEEIQEEGSLSAWITDAWKGAKEYWARPLVNSWLTGRLFNFAAPGGKLRTVAICDYWTQIAMKPIHDHLFSILKVLCRNDATFDQQGTVDRYWEMEHKPHWSFDLSAATDSIPITLYIEVLAPFLQEEGESYESAYNKALLWSKIMTDRDFALPSPKKRELGYTGVEQARDIRYGTGQPMGAYSSWASMALVHHALVQYAAWMKGQSDATNSSWFDSYLVLGDDVDISRCSQTAENYQLACADFAIKIGLAKSLKSNSNFFEFANQRLSDNGNISPLSFLEEISSQTWNSRVEFASRISKRLGIKMNPSTLFRLVTSARQWQMLIPEFQGMRDRVLTRFLHFILLGPLKVCWHSEEPISVVSITHWLQHLNKGLLEPVIKTREEAERIDQLICKSVIAKIRAIIEATESKLNAKMFPFQQQTPSVPEISSLPPFSISVASNISLLGLFPILMGHFKSAGKYSENFLTAVKRLSLSDGELHQIRSYFDMFDTATISVPKLAPISYTYIFACAYHANEDLRRQMEELKTQLNKLAKQSEDRDVPFQLFNLLVKETKSPLAELILLYSKVTALPQPIRLDTLGISAVALGVKPVVHPQDVACELLNEILPVIAQWTGVAVSNLPVLPAGGKGFKPWMFRKLTHFYKKMREESSKVKMSVYR